MDRHTRQIRLADVGPEGQRRIARAVVDVPGQGLAAEVAARYLAGAGVAALRVQDGAVAAAARGVDSAVRITIDPALPGADETAAAEALAHLADPAARAVAEGSLLALAALRLALAAEVP